MNKNEYPNIMTTLGMEVTRHCNMNCAFCMKGDSQNLDMSKEIIDKILDLVSKDNIFIHDLRLCGGEPFLCPDSIAYIIDKVVRTNILVNRIVAFTNGTIKDEKILAALKRFSEYRKSIDRQVSKIKKELYAIVDYEAFEGYELTDGVFIIVSTHEHSLDEQSIENTIKYYGTHKEKFYNISKQSEHQKGRYILSGNMLKNYKNIIKEKCNFLNVRIPINEYNLGILPYYKNSVYIDKTINISANGNVFPGSSMSYDIIDAKPMFNIMQYNSLIHPTVQWAYEHPINKKYNIIRERHKTIEWCREHGISLYGINEADRHFIAWLYDMSFASEEIAKELHRTHKTLNIAELDLLTTSVMVMQLCGYGADENLIKNYIEFTSTLNEVPDTLEEIYEWMHGLAVLLVQQDAAQRI